MYGVFLGLLLGCSIVLVVSLSWLYLDARSVKRRDAQRRTARGTPTSIGGTVSLHGRVRVDPLRIKR